MKKLTNVLFCLKKDYFDGNNIFFLENTVIVIPRVFVCAIQPLLSCYFNYFVLTLNLGFTNHIGLDSFCLSIMTSLCNPCPII